MGELADYIVARREELQAKHDALVRQLVPIQEQLRELAETQRFLAAGAPYRAGRRSGTRQGSIQDMALTVLSAETAGATAEIVREAIYSTFGRQITRESLAPQLSRLRQAGRIENRSGVYHLAATPSSDKVAHLAPASGAAGTDGGGT